MKEEIRRLESGFMLYDGSLAGKISEHVFAPFYWRTRDALGEPLGGRGAAWRIEDTVDGERIDWVLRHYRRGGLVGKFNLDKYLFTGQDKTRPFQEFRLLASLHEEGLPVPRPVAARLQRGFLFYRAAIITETLPGESLTWHLRKGRIEDTTWQAVGKCIARLHAAGVWHADLNANNILIDLEADPPAVHVIDFDRSRRRPPSQKWRQANLDRLRRSLDKVAENAEQQARITTGWAMLKRGYADG